MLSSSKNYYQNKKIVKASIRRLKIAPRKLNLLLKMIRNMKVENALNQLTFSRKRIAKDVKKCLQSAIANAENNNGLDIDSLVIKNATVGKGILMKRMRPRAKGRGVRINKFFSNLYITLTEIQEN